MAANSTQIESTLKLTATYSLISGAAVLTDASAWGSIGVVTPHTVKILLQIYDPSGALFYENTGWNAGDYTSPNLTLSSTTYSFTLPTDIAGDYIRGQYLIKTKCQVVEDAEVTVVAKDFYQNVSAVCNDITISVEGGVVAGTTEVRLTDNTSYRTYTALSRSMTLYPPPPSAQASQTGTNVDTIVYSGTVYTGVWTWKITSDVTFTDIDGVSTTCRLTGQGTFNVEQSQLCKVLCLVEKYRNQTLYPSLANKNGTILLDNYLLAMSEFQLARDGYICGKSQTVIDVHVQKVYSLLGIDPTCDCGCDDGTSQPLLSVTTVDGTDGTNGSQILYGSGVPSGSLGSVGDTYINTANGNVYKKTGATTWTFEVTLSGTAGQNGASVLENQYPDLATLGTAYESLLVGRTPYVLAANTLTTNKDELYIRAEFTCSAANPTTQAARITFNGAALNTPLTIGFVGGIKKIVFEARLSRITNTTAKYSLSVTRYTSGFSGTTFNSTYLQNTISLAGLGFTANPYNIDAQGDSTVIGDVTCTAFEVVYLHKI